MFGNFLNYHFHPNAVEGVVNYTSPQCDNGAVDGFHPTVSLLAPLNKDIPLYHLNVCKALKKWICNYTFLLQCVNQPQVSHRLFALYINNPIFTPTDLNFGYANLTF